MRPRKGPLVNFKVDDALRVAINDTAARQQMTVSKFCREAVKAAIAADLVARLSHREAA